MKNLYAKPGQMIYGHNNFRYRIDEKWAKVTADKLLVKDCHEMVQDSRGRIILLTNETKNNVIIFSKDGKVLESWGHTFPGGHGLTLHNENGTEYLYITDTEQHQVYKTTLDGRVLMTISAPLDSGLYKKSEEFIPTETAIDTNGDIFIADGYGLQYILHYNKEGKLLKYFGGRGEGDRHLDNAHGICFDTRNAKHSLIVTDRTANSFKHFDTEGNLLDVIKLSGACVCRPVIKGDHLYAAVLRSPTLHADKEGSGFVTILDKHNLVISNPGGNKPVYEDGLLQALKQEEKIFYQPHDVCVDDDENLYVAQWDSGKVYPYKLIRV
jgi:peptidylamidoglycolate lyase